MIKQIESAVNHYIIFILSVALWPFLSYLGIGFIDGILKNFALVCMFNFMLITLVRDIRKRYLGNVLYSLKYIVMLIVIVILSTLWSINKSITINNSIQLVLTTIYAIYLYMNYSLKDILTIITRVMFVIALVSIIIVIVYPEYGVSMFPNWNGLYSHKNTLGRMMVIGSIFALFYIKIYKDISGIKIKFGFITLILCLINLFFSGSTTSIMSIIITFIITKYFKFRTKTSSAIFFICISIAVFVFITQSHRFLNIFELLGKDSNFTGRTDIWEISMNRIYESKFMGYGFAASWDEDYMNKFVYYMKYMTNAHNGILQLLLDVGLLGTIVYIITFLSSMIKNSVDFHKNKYMNIGLFSILIYIFITNFFETLTMQSFSIVWVIQIIAILNVNCKIYTKPDRI